jgi:hypothetical protein
MTRSNYTFQEDDLKIFIADYMNRKYPQVPFKIELDHTLLSWKRKNQKVKMRWNNSEFIWPDVFICTYIQSIFGAISGLFLEVKRSREELFLKDGSMSQSRHIVLQNNSLAMLRKLNYAAEFVWSPESAMMVIDKYLGDDEEWKINL